MNFKLVNIDEGIWRWMGQAIHTRVSTRIASYMQCTVHYSQAIARPIDGVSRTGLLNVHQV